MIKRITVTLTVLASLVCGCSQDAPDGPPKVRYGQDECVLCGMIVSDERHAAALRAVVDGETRDLLFDDIGDMIEYEQENSSVQVVRRFVHDFDTRQWIDAAQSKFVRDAQVHTPMGSGILAFADEARARARGGQVLQWGALHKTMTTTAAAGACCEDEETPSKAAAAAAAAAAVAASGEKKS